MKILGKISAVKADCRFIKDVTVPDGTPMAPSTPFTKIWRMCNSGSTAWPYGIQLVWVGGDHLKCLSSVRLAVCTYPRIWLLCKLIIYGWVQDGMQVYRVLNFIKSSLSFDLMRMQISANGGLNPWEETDVTVDFLAPAKPGRYISYWRLALPSGVKFGQQIWVHIQVVTLPFTVFCPCHL